MLGAIFLGIILVFSPRYTFLAAFGLVLALFLSPGLFAGTLEDRTNHAISSALVLAGFFAVCTPLVALRKWMRSRATSTDVSVDQELARIRAEAAARETSQPPRP
jgi:hypothetical protein